MDQGLLNRPARLPLAGVRDAVQPVAGKSKRLFWSAVGRTALAGPILRRHLDAALAGDPTDPIGGRHAYWVARQYTGSGLLFRIDPCRLEHALVPRGGRDTLHARLGENRLVCGGDWRPHLRSLTDHQLHREAVEIFAAGEDYARTDAYRRWLSRLQQDGVVRHNHVRWRGAADLDAYFRRILWMIESMRRHGLLPRAALPAELERAGFQRSRTRWLEFAEDDVGVAVDADGTVYRYRGGYHRTAIAQCLRLDSIPVVVKLVHTDWLRAAQVTTGLGPEEALLAAIRRLGS